LSLDLEQIYFDLGEAADGPGRLAGCHIISSSSLLTNHQSATGKKYQGHVALGPARSSGQIVWLGICTYGPGNAPRSQQSCVYEGMSLEQACQAVNAKVLGKTKRDYQASESYPDLLVECLVLDKLGSTESELPQATQPGESALAQVVGKMHSSARD